VNWPNEFLAEYHRQRILEELEKIRLEKLALKSRLDYPRGFRQTMFKLGNWMISTGQQLRKRYEVRDIRCSTPRIESGEMHQIL
jgi:hypothetical protein